MGNFALGFFVAVFWLVLIWHMNEAICQEKHNVYDCEWSTNPFTPAAPTRSRFATPTSEGQ